MGSSHLMTLKAMCVNADIKGTVNQREALGWALARLSELTGTKTGEAIWQAPDKSQLRNLERRANELDALVSFVCTQNRIDRKRMEKMFEKINAE